VVSIVPRKAAFQRRQRMQRVIHRLAFQGGICALEQFMLTRDEGLFSFEDPEPRSFPIGFEQSLQIQVAPGCTWSGETKHGVSTTN
jgi:hypothetical protein